MNIRNNYTKMSSKLYKQAKYYEIAFDFIDVKKQVDLFEKFMIKYADIRVLSVLDIACGPGLQTREFAKRGYRTFGLDISKDMLSYLNKEAKKESVEITTINGDMTKFSLDKKVDFAYILMGSIGYLKSNKDLFGLLKSTAKSMASGGLFLVENLLMVWSNPDFWKEQKWDMKYGDIKITATYQIIPKDDINQIVTQVIRLEVNDKGKKVLIEEREDIKVIFPQEFKTIVEEEGSFEFLGFFERHEMKELKKASVDNIILLKRK